MDPTCIMCVPCFEKSDHTGHRTWLKTNISGCCDCGDPDGYKPEGFCSDHQGFAASSEAMVASLPPYLKQSSPQVFEAVMSVYKRLMLELLEEKDNNSVVYRAIVQLIDMI
jgi:hypothetical protein